MRITADLFADIRAAYPGDTWLFGTARGKPVRREYVFTRISATVKKTTGKGYSTHWPGTPSQLGSSGEYRQIKGGFSIPGTQFNSNHSGSVCSRDSDGRGIDSDLDSPTIGS